MSVLTFLSGIIVGMFAIILKEPEFLKELEEKNQESSRCNLNDVECAKVLIQQHLISNIRNFYKTLNSYIKVMAFNIAFICMTMFTYYLLQTADNKQINDSDILLVSVLFLAISLLVFLVSAYAFLFSQIIRKYD